MFDATIQYVHLVLLALSKDGIVRFEVVLFEQLLGSGAANAHVEQRVAHSDE